MIRINLLPKEEIPSRATFALPAATSFIPVVIPLAVAMACIVGYTTQMRTQEKLRHDIEVAQQESRKLAPQIARIKLLQREREQLDSRLDAITELDRDRYFRVHLLSEMVRKLPENTWITGFEELGPGSLRVEGLTFSNFLIADFLRDLSASEYYGDLDLEFIERGHIKDVKVIKFSLTATVAQPASTQLASARM